jgi:hypothetical protein
LGDLIAAAAAGVRRYTPEEARAAAEHDAVIVGIRAAGMGPPD